MTEQESIAELSGIIGEHLTENAAYYGGGLVFFAIFTFFTRRYTLPVLFYTIEITVYFIVMHTLTAGVTTFFAWLHNETSMQAISSKAPDVYWDIPWVYFWHTEEYDPNWIYKVECVFAVIIIGLVIRYRPMKIQRVRQQTEAAKKGEFKPDSYSSQGRAQELGKKYSNPQNIGKSGGGKKRF